MKYTQPFGISDPEAPYYNGNPETGFQGSIPPAASIEHPQRELHNFIGAAGMAPSTADLYQVARGVQNGRVMFGIDSGVPNMVSISLNPVVLAFMDGQCIRARISNTNTGPSVMQVNGIAGKQIVHPDQSPTQPGELQAGMYAEFIYDGPHDAFQLVGAISAGSKILQAPRHYYVNGTTGSDTTMDGLTAATPYKTIQRAIDEMQTVNTNGWNIEIHVADGSYSRVACKVITGSGMVILTGNPALPQNVLVTAPAVGSGGVPGGSAFDINHAAGRFLVRGFKVASVTGPGMWCFGSSVLWFEDIDFGACAGCHYGAYGTIGVNGFIDGIPSKNYISGNSPYHVWSQYGGVIDNHEPDLIFRSAVTIGTFAVASGGSIAISTYNSISGAPAAGCAKYLATSNGVVVVNGKGTGYLPGTVAGSLNTGGQYI